MGGGNRLTSDKTMAQNLVDVFALGAVVFPSLAVFGIITVFVTILAFAVTRFFLRGGWEIPNAAALGRRSALSMSLIFVVCLVYVGALVLLRTVSNFDDIDSRLISPALVCFYLGFVLLTFYGFAQSSKPMVTYVISAAAFVTIAGLLAQGYMAFNKNLESIRERGVPAFVAHSKNYYKTFTLSAQHFPLKPAIQRVVGGGSTLVVVERPAVMSVMLERNVVLLPEKITEAVISDLNFLPQGSALLFGMQNDPLQQYDAGWLQNVSTPVYQLGDYLLVTLPLAFKNKDQQ